MTGSFLLQWLTFENQPNKSESMSVHENHQVRILPLPFPIKSLRIHTAVCQFVLLRDSSIFPMNFSIVRQQKILWKSLFSPLKCVSYDEKICIFWTFVLPYKVNKTFSTTPVTSFLAFEKCCNKFTFTPTSKPRTHACQIRRNVT